MARADGTIIIDTRVNTSGIENSGKKIKANLSSVGSMAKKIGGIIAAAFAVKEIVNFGKECLELGSDLAEVQNVVDVTFPGMSAQVDKFAKSAAKSFGLSETMAKQYTGTFGSMAKAFEFTEQQAYDMGTSLTGLTGDVASFYNLSQDEAYTKLKSVFTGETESLKDLGVVMTQTALDQYALANGYGKTTSAMTEQEKVALRMAFVQNQLSAASGDFLRTSDSWANQVKVMKLQAESLKATIGQGLINVFTPVIKSINLLMEKLATAANAFKAFTELLTGKKAGASSTASAAPEGLSDMAQDYDAAADGASNLAGSTQEAADAAKEAEKANSGYLSGLDEISRFETPDSGSTDVGSGAGPLAGVAAGSAVDYGNLAEGETAVDKLSGKLGGLIKRVKELAGLFKKGFRIGFGDSEKTISSIIGHIKGIGKSLKEIFTDKSVTGAANRLLNSIAVYLGKFVGSVASIGLSIADNLVGGFDKYLQGSKDFIKKRLVSIFDATADLYDLAGDFWVALSSIFTVFSGENAKNCTASIIGMFSDGFLGVVSLALQFGRDVISAIVTPFIENADAIKTAIDNTLAPISVVLDTLHQSVKTTFEKFQTMYDEHVKPMFDSFKAGLSDLLEVILEVYNKHIAPVLDELATEFKKVWTEHIQPVIDEAIGLIGDVAGLLKALWENIVVPFVKWIIENIVPKVVPVFKEVGKVVLRIFGNIGDAVKGVLKTFRGVIEFLTGVFTGDWKKAWEGVKKVFSGVWDAFSGLVRAPINAILGIINSLLKGVESMVNGIAGALNSLRIDLPDWIQELTGYTSFGFNIQPWTAPQIPYLATGAVIPPNAPFAAVLGDQRHGTNIETPEKLLRQIIRDELGQGQQSGGSYRFTAQLNRRTVFDEIITEAKLRQLSSGKNPFELA